ncbi:MAG: glycosyltransferase [Candidatus Kapabacteria bacterium]|nr:glycosyltransferase [Candidatus Kapabacteria bacterium]
MKIAYLSTFYPYRGGIAQFNASLFKEFEKYNETKAFTFSRQYPDLLFPGSSQLVSETDIAEKIDAERILDTINPFSYLSAASKINKFNPDLLITKFWMPFFAPSLGSVTRRLKNTKRISILDNVIPHEKRIGDMQLINYFLNSNDAFIAMSRTVQNDLLSLKPNAKSILIPHPLYDHFGAKIDKEEACKKLNIPQDNKILLFFGFIRDYKGLDLLIEAMSRLGDTYHLVIAGEVYGDYSKYEKQIDGLGIRDKVSNFVRYISDEEVPLFFSCADVCILPYKTATQSGIVGISYHFDLPIISTDVGGLREMIGDFNTGLMVESPNSELIANAINEYFSSGKIEEYKQNILKYKSLANWKNLAREIIDFSLSL